MSDNKADGMIRQTIERAERLIEDRKAINEDLKEVFAEAAGNGLEVKALKAAIKYRAEDRVKREELEAVTELYLAATGGL